MSEIELRGIVPPIVTPLDKDERVDEEALVRQLNRLIDGGVHGFYFLGSTGEFVSLRDSERRRAIEIAVKEVRGRRPIVVGTMDSSTQRVIDNIKMVEDLGADAAAVTAPYYYPPNGDDEILAHFEICARSANLPIVIYNIPQTTKVTVTAGIVKKVSELENVIGAKDSSGDWTNLLAMLFYLKEKEDFYVLLGSLALTGPAIVFGADGAVMSLANICPELPVQLYNAARERRIDEVYSLQRKVDSLSRVLSYGAPISCIKAALEIMGVCGATAAAPLQPVSDEGRKEIEVILRAHGVIDA